MKKAVPNDDRSFILDPDNWPGWPFLPLKRKNNSLEDKNLGILVSDEAMVKEKKPVVYHCYLFDLPKGKEEWDKVPRTEYKNVDDLLADGWCVD